MKIISYLCYLKLLILVLTIKCKHMKGLFFLLLGFMILLGSPLQAIDFDNDVGVEYVLSVENDCFVKTIDFECPQIAIVAAMEAVPVEKGMNEVSYLKSQEPITDKLYRNSLEVEYRRTLFDTFIYATNSNEAIKGNPDLSNVNVHFGTINELRTQS